MKQYYTTTWQHLLWHIARDRSKKNYRNTYAIGTFVSDFDKEASAKNINRNKTSSTGHLHYVYTDRTNAKQP